MISNTTTPKNVRELKSVIDKLPTNTKIEVLEIVKNTDKIKVSPMFDRFNRQNDTFTIVFIGD
ncbi:MAG: hypothetical protein VW270_04810 [Candidatus Poseidoniales archaeon]